MKIKKLLILVIILVFCSVEWPNIVLGQQEKELSQSVTQLQQKIEELEKTIKAQQQTLCQAKKAYERVKKQLDEQIKENEILKTLCKEAGVDIIKIADATFNPSDIVYCGKKQTQKWFDMMYKKFHDKIAYVDGKYVYIRDLPSKSVFNPKNKWVAWKVLSDLGNGEVLICDGRGSVERIYHISGLERSFVDREYFDQDKWYICTGSFKYTARFGEQKTVRSFSAYKELTKEQFADAIKSGFKLIATKRVRVKK